METIVAIKPGEFFRSGLRLGAILVTLGAILGWWIVPPMWTTVLFAIGVGFFLWIDPACRHLMRTSGSIRIRDHLNWCINVIFLLCGSMVAEALLILMVVGADHLLQ